MGWAALRSLVQTVTATDDPEDGCRLPTQFCSDLMDHYEHYACSRWNATTTEDGATREWTRDGRTYRVSSEHAYQPRDGLTPAAHSYLHDVSIAPGGDDGAYEEDGRATRLTRPALYALLPNENGTTYACRPVVELHAVEPCLFSYHPSLVRALEAYDEYLECVEKATQRLSMWVQVMGLAGLIVSCVSGVVCGFLMSYNVFSMCYDCMLH